MGEMYEQAVASEGRSKRAAGGNGERALHQQLAERAQRRAGSAVWSTTLNAKDLACLMAVIETQLLPSLLRAHRPAERKPLNASGLA